MNSKPELNNTYEHIKMDVLIKLMESLKLIGEMQRDEEEEKRRTRNRTQFGSMVCSKQWSTTWVIPAIRQHPSAKSWNYSRVDRDIRYIRLEDDSSEYQILKQFFKSKSKKNKFTIREIQRIENSVLLGSYELKREELKNRYGSIDEQFLFHGTEVKNVHSICTTNLNWRLCGAGTGHKFGQGVSFAPTVAYACHYCDRKMSIKVVILFRVLLGKSCIGYEDMTLPISANNQECDYSIKPTGEVIVKYNDNEFCPAYKFIFEVPPNYKRWNGKKRG